MRYLIYILLSFPFYQATAELINQDVNMCLHFYVSSNTRPAVIRVFDPRLFSEVANEDHFITLKEKADKIASGELNYSKSENWIVSQSYLMSEQIPLFKALAEDGFTVLEQNSVWRFHASYSRIVEAIPHIIKKNTKFQNFTTGNFSKY